MNTSGESFTNLNLYLSAISEDRLPEAISSIDTNLRKSDASDRSVGNGEETRAEELREKIKREEFLRRQHERTIEDLRNRMKHLEQELMGANRDGKERNAVREATDRLERAIKERDQSRRECQQLQSRLSLLRRSVPSAPSPSLSHRISEFRRQLQDLQDTNQSLSQSIAATVRATPTSSLQALEHRIATLESLFEAEIEKTTSIQSRLAEAQPSSVRPTRELLDAVTRQIAANEDKVLALEMQLATAESACERLQRAISDPRNDSQICEEQSIRKRIKPKKTKPAEKTRKRTTSERPLKSVHRDSK